MNIQKTLDSLAPHIIGIRYLDGTVLVDSVFKDGWVIPDDPKVDKIKSEDEKNYHMLYGKNETVILDDILAYVGRVIKVNLEREQKKELLQIRFNELKELFNKNSLDVLNRLKFIFADEQLVVIEENEFDMDIDSEQYNTEYVSEYVSEDVSEDVSEEEVTENEIITEKKHTSHSEFLDIDGNPILLTEEEYELIADEERAKRNLAIINTRKKTTKTNIELPPKRKVELITDDYRDSGDSCDCTSDEACGKCIENKDY